MTDWFCSVCFLNVSNFFYETWSPPLSLLLLAAFPGTFKGTVTNSLEQIRTEAVSSLSPGTLLHCA